MDTFPQAGQGRDACIPLCLVASSCTIGTSYTVWALPDAAGSTTTKPRQFRLPHDTMHPLPPPAAAQDNDSGSLSDADVTKPSVRIRKSKVSMSDD